jgi:predicted signal transduction protein with EAL and GGDEF domain
MQSSALYFPFLSKLYSVLETYTYLLLDTYGLMISLELIFTLSCEIKHYIVWW